jgi:DNA topoisomerase I
VQSSLGRFGPYVVHDQGKDGKDYRSLKGDDDPVTITLDRALELLAQPKAVRGKRAAATPLREMGAHPEDGEPVNLYEGPYGTYIKHGKVNASLPEGETLESLTMDMAVEMLNAKAATAKKGGRKAAAKSTGEKKTTAKKTTKKKATEDQDSDELTPSATTEKKAAAKKTSTTKKTTTTAKTTTAKKTTKAN